MDEILTNLKTIPVPAADEISDWLDMIGGAADSATVAGSGGGDDSVDLITTALQAGVNADVEISPETMSKFFSTFLSVESNN